MKTAIDVAREVTKNWEDWMWNNREYQHLLARKIVENKEKREEVLAKIRKLRKMIKG